MRAGKLLKSLAAGMFMSLLLFGNIVIMASVAIVGVVLFAIQTARQLWSGVGISVSTKAITENYGWFINGRVFLCFAIVVYFGTFLFFAYTIYKDLSEESATGNSEGETLPEERSRQFSFTEP